MRSRCALCELEDLPDFICHLLTGDEGGSKGEQTGKLFWVGVLKKKKFWFLLAW